MEKFNITYGKVVYDPRRGDMKRRTQGWVVLEIDREFTRYFRWHINRSFLDAADLIQPSWNAHMSIVRGERLNPRVQNLWKKYDGKTLVAVKWNLDAKVVQNRDGSQFWIAEVQCPFARDVRQELGLRTDWPFHITLGKPRWMIGSEED